MTSKKTGYRIDMHVHTRGSDGVSSAEEIARAAVAAGLDGICITDHHHTYTPEGAEVAEACRALGLRVYHGCEYTTAEGHCLVYGVDVDQLNFGRYPAMQDVIDRVDAAEGIAIPAHPYHGYKTLLGDKVRALKRVVAVEGLNGQVEVQAAAQNQHAMQMAREEGLMVLGGSDAHFAQYVGICCTEFEELPETDMELTDEIWRGHHQPVVNETKRTMLQKTEKEAQARQALLLRDAADRMDCREDARRGLVKSWSKPFTGEKEQNMAQCNCGSYAANDDPKRKLCDKCLQRVRAEKAEAKWIACYKVLGEIEEIATDSLVDNPCQKIRHIVRITLEVK